MHAAGVSRHNALNGDDRGGRRIAPSPKPDAHHSNFPAVMTRSLANITSSRLRCVFNGAVSRPVDQPATTDLYTPRKSTGAPE